ncbi:pyrimidine 5'-nucleotidase [Dongia rigui]|uniref:Pyrimidine 5'-nucleotidase n=1 Tax=Dongia rigui TaxID=940149 RepID=A0ABU5DWL7_9PROT|nr:pyrimidine 5'-nucleotidase [Dongia rigui]MDY0871703.1 pyrimidine 5'-nucleotidase [Dongia rigui]
MSLAAKNAGLGTKAVGTWIFDLDNTLYPASCRLFDQVQLRIRQYIRENLGLSETEALALQKRYFQEHMTTLRGLIVNDGIDPHHFLDFVHEIDLSGLHANPALDAAIAALPGRKVIFTNGSVPHAERVMKKVGIGHHFEAVFDIVASDFVPKPDIGVYRRLCETYQIDPSRAVMIDDMPRNLVPAHDLGMTTVLVKTDDEWAGPAGDPTYIHHVTEDLASFLAPFGTAKI